MLSLFRRKPRILDPAFADLAEMLTQENDAPTHRRDLLSATQLDYSLESLRAIDGYLDAIRGDPLSDRDLTKVVLRSGAYVGEVVRRHAAREYHWIGFEDAGRISQLVRSFGMGLGTAGILWSEPENFTFPLGKVGKFLDNGPEDSVFFYAKVALSNINSPERATT